MKTTRRLGAPTRFVVALAIAGTLASCSHGVRSQADATSRIDSGAALNTQTGTYHVQGVDIALVKIVSLPDEMLGLRFSFDSKSSDCCSLFPRVGLTQSPGTAANAPTTDVLVPESYVEDGKLVMRLWDRTPNHKTSPFTVDLIALGVPSNA